VTHTCGACGTVREDREFLEVTAIATSAVHFIRKPSVSACFTSGIRPRIVETIAMADRTQQGAEVALLCAPLAHIENERQARAFGHPAAGARL
jgi:hypothetical protein